jgi:hypothetical protein
MFRNIHGLSASKHLFKIANGAATKVGPYVISYPLSPKAFWVNGLFRPNSIFNVRNHLFLFSVHQGFLNFTAQWPCVD